MDKPTSKITLHVHQTKFLEAREKYIGLYGGIGNGKSYAGNLKMIELATRFPQNLGLIGRLTFPELRDSTQEVFFRLLEKMYPPKAYTFNKNENSVTFWNKSVIIFRHLDNPENLLSMNLGAFYIDQAEEIDEEVFLTLQGRLRRDKIPILKGIITGNPKGYNWVYYKYGMDKSNGAKDWSTGQYRMITAPTIANAANLPSNYLAELQASYSPEWISRYLAGNWDAFEGQIFDCTKIHGYAQKPIIRMVLTAIDPAISKNKTACNTAITTCGVGEDGKIYILECRAAKWSFLETLEQLQQVDELYHPEYIGVEDVGYQRALFEAAQRYFPYIHIADLKADRDKFRRAKSVSHIVAKGLLQCNDIELIEEMKAFDPDMADQQKIDRVDSLVHLLHMVQSYAPIKFDPIPTDDTKLDSIQFFIKKATEAEWARNNSLQDFEKVIYFEKSSREDDGEYY